MKTDLFEHQYIRVKRLIHSMRTFFLVPLMAAGLLLLFSCATTGETYRTDEESRAAGVWHRVEEGQTL